MELILAHILVVIGSYLIAWGLRLPPVSSVKKAALHAFGPTFWGLLVIMGAFCLFFTPLLKDFFS